jgi:HTH-type transcriptional regulator/antitoxin MqsA
MQNEETCYLCGGRADLVTGTRDTSTGSRRITFEDEYYQCSNCGERFYSGSMADESFRRAAAAVRREDGLLAPEEIREIRTLYGLTQADLERLIKGGEKTVVRWERGTVAQNATADTLLRVLRDHPEVVAKLAEQRGVTVVLPEPAPSAA